MSGKKKKNKDKDNDKPAKKLKNKIGRAHV